MASSDVSDFVDIWRRGLRRREVANRKGGKSTEAKLHRQKREEEGKKIRKRRNNRYSFKISIKLNRDYNIFNQTIKVFHNY